MELDLAVSKTDKFGVSPGGDTVEVTERPNGGVSVVLSDGQGSGPPAKAISTFVVFKAVSLIADGARDGAVARAVHDALYAQRRAQVSATLTIVSADTDNEELVITRNSNCPVIIISGTGELTLLEEASLPIGTQRMIRPQVVQLPLKSPRTVLAFSDGILSAGRSSGNPVKVGELAGLAAGMAGEEAAAISRGVLEWAVERDSGRPADDISVVALRIVRRKGDPRIREMTVRYPI
ncbi:MAG: serine/threonine-protein phosphatase [Thermoleophilia bacterium]|nr:serine/threonine-protein phosphatase [Thermoleophilia bacterium]